MQRQKGPGAAGIKALPGDVFHAAPVPDGNHHGLLFVLVPGNADTRQSPDPGQGAIGADHQLPGQLTAVIKDNGCCMRVLLQILNAVASHQGYRRLSFSGLPESVLGDAVLNNVAQMAGAQLIGTELHFGQGGWQQSAQGVGGFVPHRKAAIGCGAHGQDGMPGSQAVQVAFAAGTQGRHPDIRGNGGIEGAGLGFVDQGHTDALLTKAGGKCGADHAGAHDNDVKCLVHIRFLSVGISLRDAGRQTSDRSQSGRFQYPASRVSFRGSGLLRFFSSQAGFWVPGRVKPWLITTGCTRFRKSRVFMWMDSVWLPAANASSGCSVSTSAQYTVMPKRLPKGGMAPTSQSGKRSWNSCSSASSTKSVSSMRDRVSQRTRQVAGITSMAILPSSSMITVLTTRSPAIFTWWANC